MMQIGLTRMLALCALLLLGACSHQPVTPTADVPEKSLKVAQIAHEMLGTPYRYGGRSPQSGFDCSGLVYFAHRRVGHTLPRTSLGQYQATRPVSRSSLRAGDLVFFRIRRSKISHVGIYIGNGRFIHAPSSGKSVAITSLTHPYWKRRFLRGGRVF